MNRPAPLLLPLLALALSAGAGPVFRRSMDRVSSLDPALSQSLYAAQSCQLVYGPLLDIDYKIRPYKLIPNLLKALPEISKDGRTYTLRLDEEAAFQSDPCFGLDAEGRPLSRSLTARDVVYSIKRLGDSKIASPGSWLVEDSIEGMKLFYEHSKIKGATDYSREVSGLKILDDHTLQIRLTRPMHQFIWYLAMCYMAPVAQEAVERYGTAFGSHPVGTGPYRLSSWHRNHKMVYTRRPEWIGWKRGPAAIDPDSGLVPFDTIVYQIMDDVSTQWLCFLAGELDFLGEISRDNWDVIVDSKGDISDELKQRGIALHSIPALEVAYVGINMEDPVLGPNKALRQALNCAFDSESWSQFLNNRVFPCDGPVPPGTVGRLEEPFPYRTNLEKARQLMVKAGYPGGIDPKTGRRLELTIDMGRTSQDARESVELMVSFFDRIGIALTPCYHNWPAFLRKVSERQSQMFRIAWLGDYPDAENFLQLFYGKNVSPGPNRTNYVNPEFDRLYEKACATTDPEERNIYWHQAQAILREDCPWIYLNFKKSYTLCGPRVKNYIPSDFSHGSERYYRTPARKR